MSEIFTPQDGDDPSDERPRLVLDTNTVLALWMFRDPTLTTLRAWIEAGNCSLYSREDALEELRRVLAYRQFGLDEIAQHSIHDTYRTLLTDSAHLGNRTPTGHAALLPRCRDKDDQKFLEIALLAEATHLLTRDKALLKLRKPITAKMRCRIVRPETFEDELYSHKPKSGVCPASITTSE